ncbi:MAG: SUMF1/EgtB/PvdO family nonheme iron enzyme [Planctomycetes bacterium]|nr:SUMF1/EgtB/PvdO family nonheme iron enzyme [Planctomycetota bacterium]MCB9824570.1 SUMF1/EgtB/PvdO family nonheme iron enzyme [Planctomycetota bacterium]MCB9829676.1 SUMF1/EgtB/PvdO family nonheme iron enzyme [Planctomycetota bacterium]MCB9900018.1 SUMF1/EgtB/PvdO family nonheme iron enzyme [Planctomycetota bacterium]
MSHVFLSHAKTDGSWTQGLCDALEAAGIPCWIAPRDIPAGERFVEAIVRALGESHAVVVVVSERSAASRYVLAEVKRAFEEGRKIVPVRLDGATLPPELEFYTNQHQWVEAQGREPADVLPELKAALGGTTSPAHPVASRAPLPAAAARRSRAPLFIVGLLAVAGVVGGLLAWAPWSATSSGPGTPAAPQGTPRLQITAPEATAWVREDHVTVNGTVGDAHEADRLRVRVKDRIWCDRLVGDGTIDVTVSLSEPGIHTIAVEVVRGEAVATSAMLSIERAAPAPAWHAQPTQAQWDAAERWHLPVAFENDLGMRFVLVPPGSARLGAEPGDGDAYADEVGREVHFERPFYLQVGEVDNAMWRAYDRTHSAGRVGRADLDAPDLPVVNVRHGDAERFAEWLSVEKAPQHRYRLPREAEWEYAARDAGACGGAGGCEDGQVNYGDEGAASLVEAWRLRTQGVDGAPRPVPRDRLTPNALGLRHMRGNVAEWVADRFGTPATTGAEVLLGPARGRLRVVRGGSWGSAPADVRLSSRLGWPPDRPDAFIGFRLVAEPTGRGDAR